jgi:hypothetical protein
MVLGLAANLFFSGLNFWLYVSSGYRLNLVFGIACLFGFVVCLAADNR